MHLEPMLDYNSGLFTPYFVIRRIGHSPAITIAAGIDRLASCQHE